MNFIDFYECSLCPRNCKANRLAGETGYCKTGKGFPVASIVRHRGEEPLISGDNGICNVFFAHCNLRCIYCQNYQISQCSATGTKMEMNLQDVLSQIFPLLDDGIRHVGFVSPSHCIQQMKAIIYGVRKAGYDPIFVYNSSAYDKVDVLKSLEGYIDVFLPDYKYADGSLSQKLSDAGDYPHFALEALKEMFRQKGATLRIEGSYAVSGMIIRHLVLPGYVENSLKVLENIADKLSTSIHISLMSQYYPTPKLMSHPYLGRRLKKEEYDKVCDKLEALGFYKGWVQDLSSHQSFRPNFKKDHPFED